MVFDPQFFYTSCISSALCIYYNHSGDEFINEFVRSVRSLNIQRQSRRVDASTLSPSSVFSEIPKIKKIFDSCACQAMSAMRSKILF